MSFCSSCRSPALLAVGKGCLQADPALLSWKVPRECWFPVSSSPLFSRWRMVAVGDAEGLGWSRGHWAQGHHSRDPELSSGGERELKTGLGANSALGVDKPGCRGVGRFVHSLHGPKAKSWEAIFWDCRYQNVLKRKEWNPQTCVTSLIIKALHLWLCLISLLKVHFCHFKRYFSQKKPLL